jgi:hypothetical protein
MTYPIIKLTQAAYDELLQGLRLVPTFLISENDPTDHECIRLDGCFVEFQPMEKKS